MLATTSAELVCDILDRCFRFLEVRFPAALRHASWPYIETRDGRIRGAHHHVQLAGTDPVLVWALLLTSTRLVVSPSTGVPRSPAKKRTPSENACDMLLRRFVERADVVATEQLDAIVALGVRGFADCDRVAAGEHGPDGVRRVDQITGHGIHVEARAIADTESVGIRGHADDVTVHDVGVHAPLHVAVTHHHHTITNELIEGVAVHIERHRVLVATDGRDDGVERGKAAVPSAMYRTAPPSRLSNAVPVTLAIKPALSLDCSNKPAWPSTALLLAKEPPVTLTVTLPLLLFTLSPFSWNPLTLTFVKVSTPVMFWTARVPKSMAFSLSALAMLLRLQSR
ncbi:MAG: hypothetical protein IPH76_07140 [Xanthomonadales bacterium]|nr:hypothetical protein [Xanthomonadales bacterium]